MGILEFPISVGSSVIPRSSIGTPEPWTASIRKKLVSLILLRNILSALRMDKDNVWTFVKVVWSTRHIMLDTNWTWYINHRIPITVCNLSDQTPFHQQSFHPMTSE